MGHARNQRRETALLLRLGRGQRERAHGASVERAEEGDHVLPLGVIARQLQRALDRFGAGVAVVNAMRPGHRRNLRQARGQRDHALVVKIRARHVDQFGRLLLNGGDHVGMAMAGRSHGDAGGKIEELVAVNVGNDDAASALGDQRIRAGVGRRNVFLIALEHALRVGPGQGGLDLGSDCGLGHGCCGHGILRWRGQIRFGKGTTSVLSLP